MRHYSPYEKPKMTKYKLVLEGKANPPTKRRGDFTKEKDVTQAGKWGRSDANFPLKIYQTYVMKGEG